MVTVTGIEVTSLELRSMEETVEETVPGTVMVVKDAVHDEVRLVSNDISGVLDHVESKIPLADVEMFSEGWEPAVPNRDHVEFIEELDDS